MPDVTLTSISKSYRGAKGAAHPAVAGIDFTVPDGEFAAILGPSGCGKSTTLRIVAGLERSDSGTVAIGGRDVTEVPSSERGLAMVFQNYALFPHLSVADNILFGLTVRRVPRAERDRRLADAARQLQLEPYLRRKPGQLSGGQRQRVALGRALVSGASVILMDEPLSNLDARLRAEMRAELRDLQRRLGLTILYVTHDQVEAMTMADRVVVMREGAIEQIAAPEDLYRRPATAGVARFIGSPPMNLLPASVDDGVLTIDSGPVLASSGLLERYDLVDGPVLLGVRPEDLRIGPGELDLPADLVRDELLGADRLLGVRVGETLVQVRVKATDPIPAVTRVSAAFDDVHLFAGDGRHRLAPAPASASAAL
ncbi:ABC transporter ATP-binding protein [Leifsonia aquatica]|uniref:ABC transporter ATP-binding protein n=1 Tax=Leifsonia aquatica TaxID=144185 RepID=UPI000468B247|nr:ATP-binding cassette domain-containing protein [Leifsonia aquatica]